MSKTLTLAVKTAFEASRGVFNTTQEHVTISETLGLYVQTLGLPDALKTVQPTSVELRFYGKYKNGYWFDNGIKTQNVAPGLDIENAVYPAHSGGNGYVPFNSGDFAWCGISYRVGRRLENLVNGVYLTTYYADTGTQYARSADIYTSASADHAPYLIATYDEGSVTAYADAPGGYVDRTAAAVFSWHTTWSGFPVETLAQTSATLQWKNGSSGTVNSISISGSATSYSMAANTLPESDAIYWRVQTVTADGTATSEWKTIRTTDTPAVATPISPNGTYIDGTKTSRFVWNYQTDSGAAQQGYDLQVKGPLDADYTTIKSETTSATYADVPAGTLPGGSIQWRVRAYNQSSVAGEWSAPLTCVVISAPNAPEVWVDSATPRPTVSWSAVGQLGYQVRVEGQYDSGTRFGTEKTFKIPEYLAYNEHDVFAASDAPLTKNTGTNNGVTFTWSGETCTLSGEASASNDATNVLITYRKALPASVVPGRKYFLRFASSNDQLSSGYPFMLAFSFYTSSNGYISGANCYKSGTLTIPSNAVKWYLRIQVAHSTVIPEDTYVSDIRLLTSDAGQGASTPIEVRVLGEYDLWSPWGSAPAQIYAAGTVQMLLTGEAADGDASLSWDAVTGAEKYEILRLGKKIAETTDTTYTDRYAIGSVTYRVRACFSGDEYTISNSVTISLSVPSPRLTALDGDWIRLDMYTNPLPAAQITASREVTLTQYAGIDYPVAEVGPHRTRLYVCNPAFSDHAQAAAFEQLLGRPVFVKDQYGNSLYGVMTSVQRSSQRFYTELTAMIQEIGGLDL